MAKESQLGGLMGHYTSKTRILKPDLGVTGYYSVVLCDGSNTFKKAVHRLVAEAFIINQEK